MALVIRYSYPKMAQFIVGVEQTLWENSAVEAMQRSRFLQPSLIQMKDQQIRRREGSLESFM
jgi:hypothetical protein